jgi:hypothetical protein
MARSSTLARILQSAVHCQATRSSKGMTMTYRAHQFSEGDRVRTRRRVGRLPAGSIGTIQTVFTCDVLNILFVGYRSTFLIYHDRLEVPPPQHQDYE